MAKSDKTAAKKHLSNVRDKLKQLEKQLLNPDEVIQEKTIVCLHVLNLFVEQELDKGVEKLFYSTKH